MFCFRNRFAVGGARLGISGVKWEFATGDRPVYLRSVRDDELIKDAKELLLVGKAYESEAEALVEGFRWRDRLQVALARLGGGADFGDRRPRSGGLSDHAKKEVLEKTGQIVINERPGLQVFECDPMPSMVMFSATGLVTYNETKTRVVLQAAAQAEIECSEAERLAFDLFSSSFFQPSSDARFMTLMMAIETLLDLQPRSQEAREHVGTLIQATRAADIGEADKQSMIGSLKWLRDESITQAGRRLSSQLHGREYMGLPAKRFFTECYSLRSRLAHGKIPRPDHLEIGRVAADLERFVGDLLSLSLGELENG